MQSENASVQGKGKSFSRNKKTVLKIDMTPMVDLGFLLITFFVFTTTISSPTVTDLFMPNDNYIKNPSTLADSYALTVLLDEKNQLYYYEGNWENAKHTQSIFKTNFSVSSGLGEVIRKKQQELDRNKRLPEGRKGLMLLIKPSSLSVYRNLIDALDEALINEVKKYAILEITTDEIDFLEKENGYGINSTRKKLE
jgi:biopolymer transport protein ExbD